MTHDENIGLVRARPTPEISVIVPTRNRKTVLLRQIEAVRSQSGDVDWELIVVDNGSTDGTPDVVLGLGAVDLRIRLVVAVEQADAAYARNVGASASRAVRLAFIDDDDIVGAGWLTAITRALDDHPLVAPKIDYAELNSPKVTDGWPLTQSTGLRSLRGYVVSTGHVGITAELWRRLGGQRTGFLAGEDMEMSLRATRDLGTPPVYVVEAIYHRQLPTTLRRCFRQGRRDGRGRVQFVVLDEDRHRASLAEFRATACSCWWLATRAPFAALGVRRYLWMMTLGDRVGHIEQSVRMRALLP